MAAYFTIERDDLGVETITNRVLWVASDQYDPGEDVTLRAASRMPDRVDIGWRKVAGVWVAPSTDNSGVTAVATVA